MKASWLFLFRHVLTAMGTRALLLVIAVTANRVVPTGSLFITHDFIATFVEAIKDKSALDATFVASSFFHLGTP